MSNTQSIQPPYTNLQLFNWDTQAVMPPKDLERRSARGLMTAVEVGQYMTLDNEEGFASKLGLIKNEQDYTTRKIKVEQKYQNGELDLRLIFLLEGEAAFDHKFNFLWGQQLEDLLSGRKDSQEERLGNSLVRLLNENIFVNPSEVDIIAKKLGDICDAQVLSQIKESKGYLVGKEILDDKINYMILPNLASGALVAAQKRDKLLNWYESLRKDTARFHDPGSISFYKLGEAMQEIALVLASINAVNTQIESGRFLLNTPVVDDFAKSLCIEQGLEYQGLEEARKEVFLLFSEFYTIVNGQEMKNIENESFSYLSLFGIKHLDYITSISTETVYPSLNDSHSGIKLGISTEATYGRLEEVAKDFMKYLSVYPGLQSSLSTSSDDSGINIQFSGINEFRIQTQGNDILLYRVGNDEQLSPFLINNAKILDKYAKKLESYR